MPCLNISTNVNLDGINTSIILDEATKIVASITGKPEIYVMVVLEGSVPMSFGGTEEPTAFGELVSVGALNPDVNKKLSAAISEILETKLNVLRSRFFLRFYDTKIQENAECLHALHQQTISCLNISTNVNLDRIDTSNILSDTTKNIVSIIGEPETYVMNVFKGSVAMTFGGTHQPTAYGELVSIGELNPDMNKRLTASITEILENKLHVPKLRFILKIYDSKGVQIGWNGSIY